MAILKHKNEDEPLKTPETQEFDTRLDAIKFTSEVHSRIKRDINSDFVMAILNEKDKEAITEMTANAYFVKRIFDQLAQQVKETSKNKPQKQLQFEINQIQTTGKKIFDTYMVRIYMTVLLNRNVPKNHLMKILAGQYEEENETTEEKPKKGLLKTIGQRLKKQQED